MCRTTTSIPRGVSSPARSTNGPPSGSTVRQPAEGSSAPTHSRPVALGLLLLLAGVWGGHWVVVKIGLEFMPPLTYTVLRVGGGLATLLILLGVQRRLVLPPRKDLPIILSLGIGQIGFGAMIMSLALQSVPAGRSSVLVYTMPIWVAVLLAVVFHIRPRRREVIGLLLGVGGLLALLSPATIDWTATGELLATLALLLNAAVWAATTIHIRRHHWTRTPLELQPWLLLVALVPLAAVTLALEPGRAIRWEPATVLVLVYSGPLATAFAYWASQSITRSLGPQASATGFLAVPVVGLAAGAVILHESLGIVDAVGFALLIAGIAATSIIPRRLAADPGSMRSTISVFIAARLDRC